jgi:hypothetical protein
MITFQIVPYSDIENLSSVGRIRKLLNITKDNKIVLLQGKLKKDEEKELIKATMEEINNEFKGIELATIEDNSEEQRFNLRKTLANVLLGDRQGITIIGPASIVTEIKRDPSKIELLTNEKKERRKR